MTVSRFLLVPSLLLAGALTASARPAVGAQDSAPAAPSAVSPAQARDGDMGGLETKLLARQLMTRIQEHRQRLKRLEKVIDYYRRQGDLEKVRELEHLRRRETEAYQRTLAEYRRALGDVGFDRVARALRYYISHDGFPDDSTPVRTRDLARRVENYRDQSDPDQPFRTRDLARRVENYRQQDGRGSGAREASASVDRALSRQLEVERARASQRMALAQRLQRAREQQLRLMAEQQRRYNPAGAGSQGSGPIRPGAAGAGAQGGNRGRPAARPNPPPTTRRRPR